MVLTKVKPTHPLLILQAFSQSSVDVLPYTIQDWWVEICPDESNHPAPMVITNSPKCLVIIIHYYYCNFYSENSEDHKKIIHLMNTYT